MTSIFYYHRYRRACTMQLQPHTRDLLLNQIYLFYLCACLVGALSKSVKETLESALSNGTSTTTAGSCASTSSTTCSSKGRGRTATTKSTSTGEAEEFLGAGLNDDVVLTKACKESSKTTSTSTPTLALAIAVRSRLRCRCCITSRTTENALGCGSSKVVNDLSTADATLGRNVVVCLSSEVLVLSYSLSVGRVDDHDHALLAMLGLRTVDVHGLVVDDGDHEHGCVSSLAVVVAVAAVAFTVSGSGSSSGIASTTSAASATCTWGAVGVAGDGLEVGEDGVRLGLAGAVCVGGGDTVVL